jgi:hypothetical protein
MTVEDLNRFACADCANEQDAMTRPCDRCGSHKVVLISVLELFGPDWRNMVPNRREVKSAGEQE